MPSELITCWTDHGAAIDKILARATRSLCIFDEDLTRLDFEQAGRAETLRQFLAADRQRTIRIALRNSEPLLRKCPRLMKLLATYGQTLSILQCPPHLASLSDALLLADESHGLIRFHQDQPRAKCILDDVNACRPYHVRFEDILKEGGTFISPTLLGL